MTKNKGARKALMNGFATLGLKAEEDKHVVYAAVQTDENMKPLTQVCFMAKGAIIFETIFPEEVDEFCIPSVMDRLMDRNRVMVMGSLDYDHELKSIRFRSSIYYNDCKDLDKKIIAKHIRLGLSMITMFKREIWDHMYDIVPSTVDVMYE